MKLETWDYPTATPPRQELVLVDNETLVARIDCDFVGDNPYILTKDQAFKYGALFEAAPDLLEALQQIIAANDSPPGATTGEAKVCEFYARIARAAIAKATGAKCDT